jgi:hypothetical protein
MKDVKRDSIHSADHIVTAFDGEVFDELPDFH